MAERVAVLGIGLIGGSIALCLKERTDTYVLGYDRSPETIQFAEQTGMIDEGSTTLLPIIQQADYIIIALPVGVTKQIIHQLCDYPLLPHCIVTDVGSTKSEIVEQGKCLSDKGITFIGGHPMAGSHQSGVKAADPLLFENAYYIFTPTSETKKADLHKLSQLLVPATRSQMVKMAATEHDHIIGAISHLPHIIASGLTLQVGKYNDQNHWFQRLAAGGFRDLTRIAASHPIMWRDILLSNQEEMIHLLDDWVKQMEAFRQAVESKDAEKLENIFTEAKKLREQLPERKKGIVNPIFECYVSVPDHPGVIGKIATLLGNRGINLSNIGIMENRIDFPGVLRLSFKEQEDYHGAIQILEKMGYTVFADFVENHLVK